jgi:hypothetical protein
LFNTIILLDCAGLKNVGGSVNVDCSFDNISLLSLLVESCAKSSRVPIGGTNMQSRSKIYTACNYIMAAVFLYFMYLQFNDEDPIRWSLIYGLASVACILYLARRLSWKISASIGIIALVWMLTKIPHLIGKDLPMNQVFGTMQMISDAVKECREMLGLFIVAAWMATLTFFARREALSPTSAK